VPHLSSGLLLHRRRLGAGGSGTRSLFQRNAALNCGSNTGARTGLMSVKIFVLFKGAPTLWTRGSSRRPRRHAALGRTIGRRRRRRRRRRLINQSVGKQKTKNNLRREEREQEEARTRELVAAPAASNALSKTQSRRADFQSDACLSTSALQADEHPTGKKRHCPDEIPFLSFDR
jgi:hypothetical protein